VVTSSSQGYFCLWYGGSNVHADNAVAVLPISPLVVLQREAPLLLSVGSLTRELDDQHASSHSGESSSAAPSAMDTDLYFGLAADTPPVPALPPPPPLSVAPAPARQPASAPTVVDAAGAEEFAQLLGVSADRMVHVRRSALQPLDVDLVKAKYSAEQEGDVHRNFLIALVQFAEWDYPQRESYLWPDFVLHLMTDAAAREDYLTVAVQHPLNTGARPLSEVLLFLLCAEHIGVLEEWDDAAFLERREAADSILYLLESLDEFRTTDEEVYRPFCRVADCFQVDPAQYASGPVVAEAPTGSSSVTAIDLCSDTASSAAETAAAGVSEPSLVFEPSVAEDLAKIETFFGEVELLRQEHLRVNQVIEAPLNVEAFGRAWETFLQERGVPSVFGTSARQQHVRRQLLEQFIAGSRRQNKRLTSLCTVKALVRGEPFSTDSLPNIAAATLATTPSPVPSSATGPSRAFTPPAAAVAPSTAGVDPVAGGGLASVEKPTLAPPGEAAATAASSANSGVPTSTTSASPAKVGPVPAPVSNASVIDHAAALLASSAQALGIAATSPAPREKAVVVHYGSQEIRVPLKYCRPRCIPEDTALEILYECGGDMDAALSRIAQLLSSYGETAPTEKGDGSAEGEPQQERNLMRQRLLVDMIVAAPEELDAFHTLVTRYVHATLYFCLLTVTIAWRVLGLTAAVML
jgi:hypothetical protein